jgi:acetyl-CoA synthetase
MPKGTELMDFKLENYGGEASLGNEAADTIDKHRTTWRRNKIALYWEGKNGATKKFTFYDLSELSNKFANILKNRGIKKGDRVLIFLPRVPECYVSFLGIIKTGAIACCLFSAFGEEGLFDRLNDSGAVAIITNKELQPRLDKVRGKLPNLKHVITVDESDFDAEMKRASPNFEAKKMKKEESSFMVYTSGSTGKSKGIVHSHGGALRRHQTGKLVLDYKDEDIFWGTYDPGWVSGPIYTLLSAWSNGVTELVYEGKFDPDKWYLLIEKYKVNVLATAPTALRMLMANGEATAQKYNLTSIRHIITIGEPLNPEAIKWAHNAFKVWPHDVYWQTETGGIMVSNHLGLKLKPGSMGKPLSDLEVKITEEGELCFKVGWSSMFTGVWNNEKRYAEYFKDGWYHTGDTVEIDSDGYITYVGRNDDLIKTSGERVGPFEVESTLLEHPAIAEAGVIGIPDPEGIRGNIIKAFIVTRKGYEESKVLEDEIRKFIKEKLAGHMYPRQIEFRPTLPRTQSGKIMRRVLKAQELKLPLGDLSTME